MVGDLLVASRVGRALHRTRLDVLAAEPAVCLQGLYIDCLVWKGGTKHNGESFPTCTRQ